MLDIMIKNGTVVSPDSNIQACVGVKDGKIVAVADEANMPEAERVVDAKGLYVIPGGIDTHVHFELPFQGSVTKDDFFDGTRAAAIGGTTMCIDFATQKKGDLPMAAVEPRYELSKKSCLDYAMHCIITDATPQAIADMKNVIEFGMPSFKCYMLYKREGLMAEDGDMLEAMKEARKHGALFGAHAESCALTEFNVAKALAEGHKEPIWHAITKGPLVEAEGVHRALFLSQAAGSAYYNFHLSCKEGAEMIRQARAAGYPAYAETLTHYLTLTVDKLKGPHGERYICSPALREQDHVDALWKGLADGSISTIGSDEAAFDNAQKTSRGDCFVDVANGMCGLEFRMAGVFSAGVNTGRISVNKYVEVTSTNAAKIFGLYPRKGLIAVGSDADIVLLDPNKEKTLTKADSQINIDYNPYEGMTMKGWPVMTISQGKIIVENGKFMGQRGAGRFLKLKIPSEVLERPVA